jgi:hypothetical protein
MIFSKLIDQIQLKEKNYLDYFNKKLKLTMAIVNTGFGA